ncbi:MAG TPA: DUF1080 domain-containing protein [Burkholderiales bacterium]|jgi:hypothetical protein|nr:DUF1080 domain-containing protein [Burkholderiales bacterium]
MQRRTALLAGLLVSAAALTGCNSMGNSGWTSLMKGNSLDGWSQIGAGNWHATDGMFVGEKGKAGFLVSDHKYKDFMIRAEFWVSDDANSGIFIRGQDQKSMTGKNAYEVNIFDRRPDPTYGTGAIVNTAKAEVVLKAGGKWNTYEITAKGDTFLITLNGVVTVNNVHNGDHSMGYIGLQSDGGTVKFRKFEIKEL